MRVSMIECLHEDRDVGRSLIRKNLQRVNTFAAARVDLGDERTQRFSRQTVYRQAVIDTPTRTPTFVELPRER